MNTIVRRVWISLGAVALLAGCWSPVVPDEPPDTGDGDPTVTLGAEQVLAAPSGQDSDQFGWSVATSGAVTIAGAPGVEAPTQTDRGGAYFFERSTGGSWTLADTKVGDADNDQFGFSSDVDGDYAVIGAPRPGQTSGVEYVMIFGRQGDGTWNEIEKPIDGDTSTFDDFGHSVGISGLRVVAGAPRTDVDPGTGVLTDAGLAYIFDDLGLALPAWPEDPTTTLSPSDPAANDWFGYAVAIDGDVAVVGAPGQGGHANKAYIFERQSNGSWEEQQILAPSSPQSAGGFGWSVAIDGGTIAVGAPFEDSAFGATYLYQLESGGAWSPAGRVVASDRSEDASFGITVAVDGDLVLIGAEYGGQTLYEGRAYLFAPDGDGIWNERLAFSPTDERGGDRFGRGADVSEQSVVVGAPARDTESSASNDGEAFVYSR